LDRIRRRRLLDRIGAGLFIFRSHGFILIAGMGRILVASIATRAIIA
jgi:hypothetical protein